MLGKWSVETECAVGASVEDVYLEQVTLDDIKFKGEGPETVLMKISSHFVCLNSREILSNFILE